MKTKKLYTNENYNNQDEYQRFSVSKLKTYKDCSQMFKYKYVDKLESFQQSTATLIGTLIHSTLEYFYGSDEIGITTKDSFFNILPIEFGRLGITSSNSILADLLDYHDDLDKLYKRASYNYKGTDAIRTGKGDIPKVPEMTGVWKSEVKRLKLEERKNLIDRTIQLSKKGLENVSITEAFSRTLNLAINYKSPREIQEILYLELPLSEWNKEDNVLINSVPFPTLKHEHIYLNGYIDCVAKVKIDGGIHLAVIDYKTSKETFDYNIVAHNQQLLMYAYAVEYLLKEEVKYVGILSLLKGDLILTPVDNELQDAVINNFNHVVDNVVNNNYSKHCPDSKYSTCLNSFGGPCVFLEHCWPKSYEYLNRNKLSDDFLKEFL